MRKIIVVVLLGLTIILWEICRTPQIGHLVENLWAFDTVSRITTWNTGDILTSSDLNGEFNNTNQGINNLINALDDSSNNWINRSIDSTRTISVFDLNWTLWKIRWGLGGCSVDSAEVGDSASVYFVNADKSYNDDGYSSLLFVNNLGIAEELWIETYEETVPHYSDATDSLIFVIWAESTNSTDNSVSAYIHKIGITGAIDSVENAAPLSARSSRRIKLTVLDSLYSGDDINVSFRVKSTTTDTIFLGRVELYGH